MDPIAKLTRDVEVLKKRVRALATAARLEKSSITTGTIEVRSLDGSTTQTFGEGTVLLIAGNQVVGLLTQASPNNVLPSLTYNPDNTHYVNGGLFTRGNPGDTSDTPAVVVDAPWLLGKNEQATGEAIVYSTAANGSAGGVTLFGSWNQAVEDNASQVTVSGGAADGSTLGSVLIAAGRAAGEVNTPQFWVDTGGPVMWAGDRGQTTRPYIYVHDDGVSMPTKMQSGTVTLSVSGGAGSAAVVFGTPFNNTPRVLLCPQSTIPVLVSVGATGMSTTGFTANIRRSDNVATTVHWLAVTD